MKNWKITYRHRGSVHSVYMSARDREGAVGRALFYLGFSPEIVDVRPLGNS